MRHISTDGAGGIFVVLNGVHGCLQGVIEEESSFEGLPRSDNALDDLRAEPSRHDAHRHIENTLLTAGGGVGIVV